MFAEMVTDHEKIKALQSENDELKTKLAEAQLKVAELQQWHDSHI